MGILILQHGARCLQKSLLEPLFKPLLQAFLQVLLMREEELS